MKIWLVKRTDDIGYDEYDSYVCVAKTKELALSMHEMGGYKSCVVTELGAAKRGVIGVLCESFNAG